MSSNRARDNVEDRQEAIKGNDEINLGEYFALLRPHRRKILLLSLLVGLIVLLVSFLFPNIYRATATIAPSTDEEKNNPALGALSNFGITVGGPSKVEDLEAVFKSNDLTVRVFSKHNLWQFIYDDDFNMKTGKIKVGWLDRMRGENEYKVPDDWAAIRTAEDRLRVSMNRRMGNLTVSFDSISPSGSASIAGYYLEEAKSRLQEEAFKRATHNKEFIMSQIGNTVDALTRDRLYSIYGREVEKEMLARNREQFGFKIVDTPRIPDRKIKPKRAITAVAATLISFLVFCVALLFRARNAPS